MPEQTRFPSVPHGSVTLADARAQIRDMFEAWDCDQFPLSETQKPKQPYGPDSIREE